jgi:prepilin-type N-terminal cleavage/methylation domain-containing protein
MTNSGRRNLFDLHRPVIRSTFSIRDCRGSHAGRETRTITGDTAAATGGFTLIEVLVVIAIIIILAGLILSTAGYVQRKGLRVRAETEVAAMSAALESYKADNGIYPRDNTTNQYTDTLDARQNFDATQTVYQNASLYLYEQLSGDTSANLQPPAGAKIYFSFKPQMLGGTRDANGNLTSVSYIRDPFRNSYGYSTAYQAWVDAGSSGTQKGYNPTFDLWSTSDPTPTPTANPTPTPQNSWIKNW